MRDALSIMLLSLTIAGCQIKEKEQISKAETRTADSLLPANDNKYVINGTIRGLDTGWIYFAYEDSTGNPFTNIDSAEVINGRFKKQGEVTEPLKAMLGKKTGRSKFFGPIIFIDRGNLAIDFHKDSLEKFRAAGNASQDQLNAFVAKSKPHMAASNSAYFMKLRSEKQGLQSTVDSLEQVLTNYTLEKDKMLFDEVKRYPESVVTAYLVKQYLVSSPDADAGALYEGLAENTKKSLFGREILKIVQARDRTAIGSKAPVFTLPDNAGRKTSLTSFYGKYTLLDFWASWCGPCRAEHPNLLNAYDSFKGSGFEIVSISLDDNRNAWLKAVQKDKLLWTQLSDLKGSDSEVKELYGVKSIPMNYLLDEQGIIIGKNLRGKELQKKLAEVLVN